MHFKRIVGMLAVMVFTVLINCTLYAGELQKGSATVYSLKGKTAIGTDARWGICATGNKDLVGKHIILYQQLPSNSVGECLGIFSVEDTGCKQDVIDIWCPAEYQKMIIDRTYENGCNGKVYIQIVEE